MSDNGDEHGTKVEPVEAVRRAWDDLPSGSVAGGTRLEPAAVAAGEASYRPAVRPPVPRLTVLDDGRDDEGESVRLRDAVTVIGRTEGQVRLPHDMLVSGRHAEIVRESIGRSYRWLLRDLGSANGTFVRCSRAVLRPDAALMIGGRRFRFRHPRAVPPSDWPLLTEAAPGGVELVLAAADLTLGRSGPGVTLGLDDSLLASPHARIVRDSAGVWRIESLPSRNGVWIQIASVQLVPACRFQVGEQRFLFEA